MQNIRLNVFAPQSILPQSNSKNLNRRGEMLLSNTYKTKKMDLGENFGIHWFPFVQDVERLLTSLYLGCRKKPMNEKHTITNII